MTLYRPPARRNLRFSPSGTRAVCLRSETDGEYVVELWTFAPDGTAQTRELGSVTGSPVALQPGVDDTGTVLLCHAGGDGRHELTRFDHDGPTRTAVEAAGFSLSPAAGLAVSYDEPTSTVWDIGSGRRIQRITEVDGLLTGGQPLDTAGRYVAFNQRTVDNRLRPLCVDTASGATHTLTPGRDGLQLLLARPGAGRLLFAVDITTQPRFATAALNPDTVTANGFDTPERLNATDGTVRPLAFDAPGTSVYLAVTRGVRSHLLRHDLATDTAQEITIPLGVVDGPAVWTDCGLRFPLSTPTLPYGIATAPGHPSGGTGIRLDVPRDPTPGTAPSWVTATVERYRWDGAAIEALVYGADWRTAPRVLIALHGGPESAWLAEFDYLLQALAAAGITVIAPNQRGSTGYGWDHQRAVDHAWGGPDLADIHQLADHVTGRRAGVRHGEPDGRLMLFGVSYGAYLALLAAATRPERWSHCVAAAPFLSGRRLYADASPPVRRLLDRLGASTILDDQFGERDLTLLAGKVRTNTLIVHGSDDDVIPVAHARQLHRRIAEDGHCPYLRYVEVPGGGHSPLTGSAGPRLMADVTSFLTTPHAERR